MNMNAALWVVQVILGIKMLSVSYAHGLGQSRPAFHEAIEKLGAFSKPLLYAISLFALLGTLGLILPGVLGLSTWLTAITALSLSVLLLFSIFFHVRSRSKPKIFVSIVLLVFALFVAYGRWI